jgi:hypothetical protein
MRSRAVRHGPIRPVQETAVLRPAVLAAGMRSGRMRPAAIDGTAIDGAAADGTDARPADGAAADGAAARPADGTPRPRPVRAAVAGAAVLRHARREPARLAWLPWLAWVPRLPWMGWLARVRPSWLARPLRMRRYLARTAQQLPVVVLVDVYRSA